MKLLKENTPFDITEYCGNLIVTFLSADAENVQPLLNVLDKNGYEYIRNEIGFHTLLKNSYLSGIENNLNICGCYVLFLTDNFNNNEYRVLKNNIFYQIGYIEARKEQIIVPFVQKGANVNLAGTPVQQQNAISTFDELLKTLNGNDERFRSIIMQNSFYESDDLNYLTKDRIKYRKLYVSLDIAKKDLKNAMSKYGSIIGDPNLSEEDFINALRYNLTCGARVISFGTPSRLTTHLSPYADEIKCINTEDFPTSFKCSHRYKKYSETGEKEERIAKYKLEIILPTHELLGVNFKSFIKATHPMLRCGKSCRPLGST